MRVILLTGLRKRAFSLALGRYALLGYIALAVFLGCILFYSGGRYALYVTKKSFTTVYTQVMPTWSQELAQQQASLQDMRADVDRNLDALATRLGRLQVHIMRLDALGTRLAAMADMDEISFDAAHALGVGGVQGPDSIQSSMKVNDFVESLDLLQLRIDDRANKLAVMESMLIEQVLQDQTTPAGRPVASGWISSLFGRRTDPMTGRIEHHAGIDFAGRTGTAIVAAAAGIVTWSGARYNYGNMVEINHGNGYHTRYAHNKENLVVVGQKVEKGQRIATMGSTGRSTGPHLHFEVIQNNKQVNPYKYVRLD